MLGWLFLLFVTVPLVELALLIWIGRQIDVLPTVAIVVGTGIVGAALTRYQGLRTLARFQVALREGRLPHRELVDGILILVAGAVLLTPGVLTDAVGLILLVPAARAGVRRRLGEWLRKRVVVVGGGTSPPSGDPPIVDAEFTVREDT